MAYTTINKHTDYFNTKTWSGNNTDPTTISGLNFQPDMIWGKARSGTYSTQDHCMNDAVRGANKVLRVNQTNAEETDTNNIKSFTSDGWTMGDDGKINKSSTEYVGWSWKANGQGSSNTDGSTSSTVSANTTSGFSIVQHSGSGGATTIGHGLGVAPKIVLSKRTSGTNSWFFQQNIIGGSWTSSNYLILNTTAAAASSSSIVNNVSSSTISFAGGDDWVNASGSTYIHYVFAEKKGYSKFGTYTGNGNTDGKFIYTGFKPSWVMFKNVSTTNDWFMIDNSRDTLSPNNPVGRKSLFANTNGAEVTRTTKDMDFLSNGIKLRTADGTQNNNNENYIYMAFGQSLVGSNNVPCTAR